ncbi:MAG TPA: sigma-70 family RNA polymerase sigma factor [Gemmatimonadaceae bacterium]|nr:sigma-70 family RNA polymerase sigma factor [Gemmatimonadaceae bacterium]
MDDWMVELRRGNSDPAWDLFLGRYRRLIFAAIRHYAQDYDDVMDVFARVCESLREDDFRRLRTYIAQTDHRASFSTWLVTVVRNLTIDWFRVRDGRHRISAVAERLPPTQRRIFEHVFLNRRSHVEAYELLRASTTPTLSFKEFLSELRQTYHAVTNGRRGHLLAELGAPAPNDAEPEAPAHDDGALEQAELLEEALGLLSPQDRVAVQMYVVDELPAADVARVVGLPNAKAVYNRVYRALAILRERLERAGVRGGGLMSIPDTHGRLTGHER